MNLETLNRIVKLAKEKNIEIKNTPEGKKILEQLKNSKRDGKSVSANSISDKDVAKMKEMLSGFTGNKPSYKGTKSSSANSISDRDVDLLTKSFGVAGSSKKKKTSSANSISDKDVRKGKAMKKGGVVKYSIGGSVSNFKGCY